MATNYLYVCLSAASTFAKTAMEQFDGASIFAGRLSRSPSPVFFFFIFWDSSPHLVVSKTQDGVLSIAYFILSL